MYQIPPKEVKTRKKKKHEKAMSEHPWNFVFYFPANSLSFALLYLTRFNYMAHVVLLSMINL